jgi:hypothetical protein
LITTEEEEIVIETYLLENDIEATYRLFMNNKEEYDARKGFINLFLNGDLSKLKETDANNLAERFTN